jgi:hypothetical protein
MSQVARFREWHQMVPPEIPLLAFQPPSSLPRAGLQKSLWNPQCDRKARKRSFSSRRCPRKMFFAALLRFYVQRFVMWSSAAVRRSGEPGSSGNST